MKSAAFDASMRDLVALSTLPAVWGDFRPDQIAESLADVLVGMVDLDLLLVRVPLSPSQPPYDAVRTRTDGPYASEQVRTLADALPVDPGGARTISRPDGGGALGMVAVPLGLGGDCGVLVAASEAPRFPSENDRLFLTVGANQAAMVLQRRRAEEQLQRSQRELSDFVENAVVGLHRVGPDGRILWANRAELDLLGYTPRGVHRTPRRRRPRRPGDDRGHPPPALGSGRAAQLPGPLALQGRLDQARADQLQRPLGGRSVRPYPLLHARRDRAWSAPSRGASCSSAPARCSRRRWTGTRPSTT